MHEDVQFADDHPRRKPDYEVKRAASEMFWVDPCPPAGIEIRTTDDVPALLLNGVDVAEELRRMRRVSVTGLVFAVFASALAIADFVYICLYHL